MKVIFRDEIWEVVKFGYTDEPDRGIGMDKWLQLRKGAEIITVPCSLCLVYKEGQCMNKKSFMVLAIALWILGSFGVVYGEDIGRASAVPKFENKKSVVAARRARLRWRCRTRYEYNCGIRHTYYGSYYTCNRGFWYQCRWER